MDCFSCFAIVVNKRPTLFVSIRRESSLKLVRETIIIIK